MAGYNRVVMIGNLTRDPEYRELPSGQGVTRLGLATNRQYRNRQTGDMVQEVCFVDIDVFGAQAESCRQYLQKGRPVLVEGRLKFDTWQAPDGQTRSKHSIVADRVVFLGMGAGDSVSDVDTSFTSSSKEETKVERVATPESPEGPQKASEKDDEEVVVKPAKKEKKKEETQATSVDEESSIGNTDDGSVAFKDEPPFEDDLPF